MGGTVDGIGKVEKRQIATLQITSSEEQIGQCRNITPEGRNLWMQDRGKPVRVYLPPHPVGFFPVKMVCPDQISFDLVALDGLAEDLTHNPDAICVICRHMVDMD